MAAPGKLLSFIARDHQRLAEAYLREGNKQQAAEAYAKIGDYGRAAEIAAEIRDEPLLVRCSLLGALGYLPRGGEEFTARQAGELLASIGHFREAIPLFDLAGDLRRAAAAALKAAEPETAARFFESARDWPEAAIYYEKAELPREALRVLEIEAKSLARLRSGSPARLEEVNLKRAELLIGLGRSSAAAALLQPLPETVRKAELLERAGRYAEAINAYLSAGEAGRALELAKRSPGEKRWVAQVYLRSGRPLQAGTLFDQMGLTREAAEAYEAAGEWGHAAYRWESAGVPERAAEVHLQAGRTREAARCFAAAGRRDRAVSLYVQSGDVAAAAALHLRAGEPVEAVGLFAGAGETEQAVQILRQIEPQDPNLLPGVLLVAPQLVEGGRAETALDLLRQASGAGLWDERNVQSVDGLYWEGRALEALRRHGEAREAYQGVVRRAPRHRDVATRLAGLKLPSTAEWKPEKDSRPAAGRHVEVGQRLADRYDILAEIGRGGMGKVYKAQDVALNELVAIKTLLAPEDRSHGEDRLLRELQICRRISHPNVVRVFDLGRFEGGIFITMELLQGDLLDRFISAKSPEPLERIRFFLSEIAAGLAEAHSLGIIHRDLKPSNVMVVGKRLKILDFGIARMAGLDTKLTRAGAAVGSPMYMSPEQLMARPLDHRSDLYSLGIVAYALIAGREPFKHESPTVVGLKRLQEELPDIRRFRPDLPEPWLALLDRLLAKKPAERYGSAEEVLGALAALPTDIF
ncbi:MAG TPA: protein kinase [Thermoanaerobaculia bacterium]|jgi:tetratricopeptide (TPR) repeat protein